MISYSGMATPEETYLRNLRLSQVFKGLVDRLQAALPLLLDPLRLPGVELETTTSCTRRCEYCPPHASGRMPRLLMSRETYDAVLASLRKVSFKGWISFNLYGESLLDDRLEEWLSLAAKALPGSRLAVFTNGDRLTRDRYLSLKKAGMGPLLVSLHSGMSEKLSGTLAALKRDHPDLYSVTVTDYGRLYEGGRNPLGILNNKGGLAPVTRNTPGRCRDVEAAAVDCFGNVLLCCNDCTASYVFGNVLEKDLLDIWSDPVFAAARLAIMRGKTPFEICRRCMGPDGKTLEIPPGDARRLPQAFHDLEAGLAPFRRKKK